MTETEELKRNIQVKTEKRMKRIYADSPVL